MTAHYVGGIHIFVRKLYANEESLAIAFGK